MNEYIFKLPDLGEGTVEAEISEWMVKVGDVVEEEDTICAMLTDKAAVELTAPVGGRITSLAGEVGDTLAVGAPLIIFATSQDSTPPAEPIVAEPIVTEPGVTEPTPSKPSAAQHPADHSSQTPGKVKTSPSIRQKAREAGVNLEWVEGSGPRGRILQSDFEAYLSNKPVTSYTSAPGSVEANGTTELKVVGLRRKIAQRMEQANHDIPHFAYVEEVDVTALESLRQHLNSSNSKDKSKLTLLPFIGLALTRVLQDFPQCNAHYDSERNVLIQHEAVHLGIATQTKDGLKVPAVHQAQSRSLQELADEIRRVSSAARDNSARIDELSGSTITLTSLGKLGGVVSTPIINQPELAIIGVNKAVDRAMVVNGEISVRRMMNLSSSFDHRFVDGYDAAEMIQSLKILLEQPARIFIA